MSLKIRLCPISRLIGQNTIIINLWR